MAADGKMSRRVVLGTFPVLGIAMSSKGAIAKAGAADPSRLRKASLGGAIRFPNNNGDTWVAAWASDNQLYSPSNDALLFNCKRETVPPCDRNIAFSRINLSADLSQPSGIAIDSLGEYGRQNSLLADGCSWKSSGFIWVDGAFYLVVARHKYGETSGDLHRRQTASNASIIRSDDFGKTWTRSAAENLRSPMFPGRRFATPYFIQYGYGHRIVSEHNAGKYVYALANDGFWDCGSEMILGRVERSRLGFLEGADWEYYVGGDGMRSLAWSHDAGKAVPVIRGERRHGMTGATYLPERRKYLMIGWYYPAGGGKAPGANKHTVWDFYESDYPWGPWYHFESFTSSPAGWYSPEVCPKYISRDRVVVLTAGNWESAEDYRLTAVPVTLS